MARPVIAGLDSSLIAELHDQLIPDVNYHDQVQCENSIGGAFWTITSNVDAPLWLVLEYQGHIHLSRSAWS
jgi:hypothetical protein